MAVIALIGAIGYFKGLNALAKLEKIALGVTLLIIVALFAGFSSYDIKAVAAGIQWPKMPSHSWWEIITIVGGTLIVVQGFETSRYLGKAFDASTRIRSSRLSQIISTIVYLSFIALATPLMHFLGDTVKDNDLIMLAFWGLSFSLTENMKTRQGIKVYGIEILDKKYSVGRRSCRL